MEAPATIGETLDRIGARGLIRLAVPTAIVKQHIALFAEMLGHGRPKRAVHRQRVNEGKPCGFFSGNHAIIQSRTVSSRRNHLNHSPKTIAPERCVAIDNLVRPPAISNPGHNLLQQQGPPVYSRRKNVPEWVRKHNKTFLGRRRS
jgi:hypothetical protein